MTIKRYVNIVCFFLLSVTFLFSGTEGQIRGKITNVEGESLIGAQIYIEELGLGAVADLHGNYIILNIQLIVVCNVLDILNISRYYFTHDIIHFSNTPQRKKKK